MIQEPTSLPPHDVFNERLIKRVLRVFSVSLCLSFVHILRLGNEVG